jgi:nucleoside 2-deoxyribosyltransferase
MKIYIAAPLFNGMEKTRNVGLRDLLASLGHQTYLPQEDGGIAFDMLKTGSEAAKIRKDVFRNDVKEIRGCDAMLCVLDGRVPDEGVCVEVGMAYVLGKRCVGYKTDQRSLDKYGDNLMIEGCLEAILRSEGEIREYFKK